MFRKLFLKAKDKVEVTADGHAGNFRMVSEEDMLRYEYQELLFQKVFETEDVLHDGEDKIVLLKKVFSLYRSRLFVQGEDSIGGWLLPYTAHYNQVFVDITTELLKMLGRRRDFRCIMDYAPVALEIVKSAKEYVSADALRKNYTIHSLQSRASFSCTIFAVN